MDYEATAVELMRIQALLNRLKSNQLMDEYTQGEIFAMGYLYEVGGKGYPKDISAAMAVSSARVAVLLNHMEDKGWIRRQPDEHDSRKTVVAMTEAGEEMFLLRQREVLDSVVAVLEKLGEDDAKALLRIRKKMINE